MTYIYVHLQASGSFDKILVVVDGGGEFEGTLPSAPDSDDAFNVDLDGLVPGSYLTVTLRYNNDSPLSNDPSGFFVDSVCEDSYGCMLMKKQSILLVLFCCSFC